MMQNGSHYYCIYYSVIIVGVIVFISAKAAFYTTMASIVLYLLLVFLTNIFKDNIIIVLPPQQLLIMDIILLTGAGGGALYILYSGWQLDKIRQNGGENLLSSEEIEEEQEKYQILYSKIITAFEIDKIYTDAEMTMVELADKLDTNVTYIYKALKQHGIEDSFVNFTNRYRVKAFKDHIEQGNYDKFTIQYLYEQCGFKHQSTFNKVFKQFEGVTPSEYIAMYKSKQKKSKS
jgi:AraC-like DNA-binding protein